MAVLLRQAEVTDLAMYRRRVPTQAWFEAEAARILAIIRDLWMPEEFGGKKFANGFKTMIEETIQKAMKDSQKIIQEAADELADVARQQAKGAARAIRAEAQVIRETLAPYTGNLPPEDVAEVTQKNPTDQEGGKGKAA